MSGRVAILTPDPADEGYRTRWRDVLERNAEPLRAAGIAVEGRSWAQADDLAAFEERVQQPSLQLADVLKDMKRRGKL